MSQRLDPTDESAKTAEAAQAGLLGQDWDWDWGWGSDDSYACNQGFRRDDSLRVLVVIGPRDDNELGGSQGNPEDWTVSLRGLEEAPGQPGGLYVYGVLPDENLGCESTAPRLLSWVSVYNQASRGEVSPYCGGPSWAEDLHQRLLDYCEA